MKNFFLVIVFGALCSTLAAQKIDNVDSIYQDKTSYLIRSEVISVDSINSHELQKRVKEWASTAFVNLKEVLVGETENQLTLVYITKSFYVTQKMFGKVTKTELPWYIRLIVHSKDGKIRLQFYDDGNATNLSVGLSARTYRLHHYCNFSEMKEKYVEKSKEMYGPGLYAIRESVLTMLQSCKSSVISQVKGDW